MTKVPYFGEIITITKNIILYLIIKSAKICIECTSVTNSGVTNIFFTGENIKVTHPPTHKEPAGIPIY